MDPRHEFSFSGLWERSVNPLLVAVNGGPARGGQGSGHGHPVVGGLGSQGVFHEHGCTYLRDGVQLGAAGDDHINDLDAVGVVGHNLGKPGKCLQQRSQG